MSLNLKQEAHLVCLQVAFHSRIDKKYREGAEHHGGDLWDKSKIDLIDEAIDECIDQFTYLMTLRDKIYEEENTIKETST